MSMDVVDELRTFEAYMREWTETGGFAVHTVAAEKAALAIAEITRLRTERAQVIEECAKVAREAADNAKRRAELLRGDLVLWKAQHAKAEEAENIAASIRALNEQQGEGSGNG